MSKVLDARETRDLFIQEQMNHHQVIVSVHANIPGENKEGKEAYFLLHLFSRILEDDFIVSPFFYESKDGPYSLFMLDRVDSNQIKKRMVQIEDTHDLGRLIDIDVYEQSKTLHREHSRKCYLCDEVASVCVRNQTHQLEEIEKHISNQISYYFQSLLYHEIDEAILKELWLDPKFGLVTPSSNGSHKDMDYNLMISAKDAIIPYFLELFFIGYKEEQHLSIVKEKAIQIGLLAEQKMLQATRGVNAYKGLIYHLGYTALALGIVLRTHGTFPEIFTILKNLHPDYESSFIDAPMSYGKQLFLSKGIGGARKEMALGLPHVQKALTLVADLTSYNLFEILVYFITNIEDTTMMKRLNEESEEELLKKFRRLNLHHMNEIEDLTKECISRNLSFGGAADLLIVTIFLYNIKGVLF